MSIITITAGHSNSDPGAVNGKHKESEKAALFRNAVAHYLTAAGLSVKVDGVGTNNKPLSDAIKLINGARIALEIHLNSSASKTSNGVETISLPKDKKLAQQLSGAVSGVFGLRLRGDGGWIDQTQSHRGKLGFVSKGGLILELCFISNDAEVAQFDKQYWKAAKAVAEVIISEVKAA